MLGLLFSSCSASVARQRPHGAFPGADLCLSDHRLLAFDTAPHRVNDRMANVIAVIIDLARAHHYWAYGLVLLLAASEAVPVIGLLVPATAIILGVSALVPIGAVGLWPLIVCVTAGAILGDGLSYWLGHHYHHEITERWPLSRYPELIARGETLCRRHGGKSVFIARFTPGVRSVIPLIAGILHMPMARFYSMNVLSAVLWGPSHVLAGALIGAALVLVGAVAARLAVFLVVLVALLWIVAWVIRLTLRRLPALFTRAQAGLSDWARAKDTWMRRRMLPLLDPARMELQGLAMLGALLVGGLWVLFGVLEDVVAGDPLVRADAAIFHLLQSLRTVWADQVMVAITELGSGEVTIGVTVAALLWLGWRRAWRAALYCVAAVGSAGLFTLILKVTLHQQRPAKVYSGWDAFSFPSGHTSVNAALYTLMAMLVAREVGPRWRAPVVMAAALFVSAIAFSRLYLGAHWISDVVAGLAFGIAWAALLSISYVRRNPPPVGAGGLCAAVGVALAAGGAIQIERQHVADMTQYAVRETTRTMAVARWWQEGWAELPARRVDLGGELEEPLTVQWAGQLADLEWELNAGGWRNPVPWTIQSTLAWVTPRVSFDDLPVLSRLEDGQPEGLVLVRPVDGAAYTARFVLRLWRSGIHLTSTDARDEPLWIGTVVEERLEDLMGILVLTREMPDLNGPRDRLTDEMPSASRVQRDVAEPGWDGFVVISHESCKAPRRDVGCNPANERRTE
jgi:membrane protein DedA with SNARE-associated domain/membrane-associated phospholipid phosphatase